MKPNPILEEVWRVKDELAREAGHDIHRLCEKTRQWAAAHPHPGPVVRNAEGLCQLVAEKATPTRRNLRNGAQRQTTGLKWD